MNITEVLAGQFTEGRIDKENRTIKGVLLMNKTSNNLYFPGSTGTRWSESFLKHVAAAVSGVKIYNNHVSEEELKKHRGVRSTDDLIGFYENGRIENGLPRADIRYLKHQAAFVESLMAVPEIVGLSIVANGSMSYDKQTGIATGDALTKLSSVDLVSSPGSTASMFESSQKDEQEEEQMDDIDEQIIAAAKEPESPNSNWC